MRRTLTNQDIAVIMETRAELMATQNARGKARSNSPLNFWWAVGKVFGIEPEAAQDAVRHAEWYGMGRQ